MKKRWLAAIVGLIGCNFTAEQMPMMLDNSCADDTSCAEGICDGDICIDDSGASVDVAIEVLRSESDVWGLTPASWAFAAEPASGAIDRDLGLPATRQVRGTVRWNDMRIPATLRFVRRMPASLDGLSPVAVEIQTLREAAGADGVDAFDFGVILVAGAVYDVVVVPTTDMVMGDSGESTVPAVRSLPPLYLELAIDGGDPSEPFRFDVEFPEGLTTPCSESRRTACTLEAEVFSAEGLAAIPEPGLQVRAIEVDTERVVSSIGETDEDGRVTLRIGQTSSDYLIRVTSSVGRDPFPAVSVDPEVVLADDRERKIIYIPRLRPIQASGRVQDVQNAPVAGATVRFLSTGIFGGTQLGLEGSFSASAVTSEDGTFSTELLPGFYSISVTPPGDIGNTWGVLTSEAAVAGEITSIETLTVPPQVGLRGWVSTFREEVAPGVTVVARARPITDSIATHRSQEVVSNSIGAFAMSVDEGVYDMSVKVPSESGFAWLLEPGLSMNQDRGDLARSYRLRPPIPIRGFVLASDGSPVADAVIRGYVLMEEGAMRRRLQIAETVSREDGSYQLLIAPGFEQ